MPKTASRFSFFQIR